MTIPNGERFKSDGRESTTRGAPIDVAEHDGAEEDAAASLAAWCRGDIDLAPREVKQVVDAWAFAKVRALAEKVSNIETLDEALELLLDEGLIDRDEARTDI